MRKFSRNLHSRLANAGATLNDIVKMTVFVTNADQDLETLPSGGNEFFAHPYPQVHLSRVSRLVHLGRVV